MRTRVLRKFAAVKLADLSRADLQEFADSMAAEGLAPSTIQVTLLPVRAIYRRAISRDQIAVSPFAGLELPAIRGRRERFAPPEEAETLLDAICATALYGGLRRGEIRALRPSDVDLAEGVIRVEKSWDDIEGETSAKTKAGRRRVPIPAILRDYLLDALAACGPDAERVFRFDPRAVTDRADKAWEAMNDREREAAAKEGREPELLQRITLHECRHTYASLMIAAGVNAKGLSTFMGHANISITLDRYGHLMPGSETEAAGLLDVYLDAQRERAEDAARSAGTGEPTGEREAESAR